MQKEIHVRSVYCFWNGSGLTCDFSLVSNKSYQFKVKRLQLLSVYLSI